MILKKKKEPKEEVIFQILFAILILILIGIIIVSNFKISKKRTYLLKKIESLKKEIQDLEEKKKKLEAGISQTEKESYWEEIIRQKGYVKEGENQVVVLPPPEGEQEELQRQGFFQNLFEKLKIYLSH